MKSAIPTDGTKVTQIHVHLTGEERNALTMIAARTGRTENDLVREAVDDFVASYRKNNRLDLLREACGMWKDRTDLIDFERLRLEIG